jgi:DnaJ-class molecular chaperone
VAPGGRDHFLQLRVITEDGLRVDGLRVHYKLELFPPDAALGCAVDVPTLDGPVTLQVPPGSSSGRLLRLRGRGLSMDDQLGDQLVEVVVVIPSDLGEDERALYRRLQELAVESEIQ